MDIDQQEHLSVAMEADEPRAPRIQSVEPLEDVPVLYPSDRVARKRRATWKILERLPALPTPVPDKPSEATSSDHTAPGASLPHVPAVSCDPIHTKPNAFGLYQEFPVNPTHNPDDILTVGDLAESQPPPTVADGPAPTSCLSISVSVPPSPSNNTSGPFANSSIFGLLNWMWTGSVMKSVGECIKLFNFLQSDAFRKEDIMGVDFVKETAKLDAYMGFQPSRSIQGHQTLPEDGWKESEITIQIPDGNEHTDNIPKFAVPGLHHRSITAVIRSVFEDPIASRRFHYTPFKSFWKGSESSPAQRVYDEIYSSDAMIDANM